MECNDVVRLRMCATFRTGAGKGGDREMAQAGGQPARGRKLRTVSRSVDDSRFSLELESASLASLAAGRSCSADMVGGRALAQQAAAIRCRFEDATALGCCGVEVRRRRGAGNGQLFMPLNRQQARECNQRGRCRLPPRCMPCNRRRNGELESVLAAESKGLWWTLE